MSRAVYLVLGFILLGVAFLGALLPVLPSTIWVLGAAFCFSKSSERWHRYVREHRVFGPVVVAWSEHHAIPLPAKRAATMVIVPTFGMSMFMMHETLWLFASLPLVGAGVLSFIWTRPSGA